MTAPRTPVPASTPAPGTSTPGTSTHARALAAVALALALAFLLLMVVSQEPVAALRALMTGALPEIRWSPEAGWSVRRLTRFGAVVEDTVTLSLLGLAVLFGFRARQFSIGADGQFFLAALSATWVSVQCSAAGLPWLGLGLACATAVGVGFVWGWLPGLLKAHCDANEIVTTLMLNVIAVQGFRWVVTHHFNDPGAGFIVTPSVPALPLWTPLLGGTRVTVFLLVLPLCVAGAWALLYRSTLGLALRTVGDAPAFAERAGMPVRRTVALSMAVGGGFAGLAGLHVSHAVLGRLPVDLNPGIGYEGLVVALLARNEPKAVPVAALMYACLKGGAQAMERSTDVSRDMVLVLQAFIILFVVAERLQPVRAWARWRAGAARRAAR